MSHSFNLSGKTAIVTGGGGILGQEFCRALANAGAKVGVVDIAFKKASETAALILRDFPKSNVIAIECDVTNSDSINKMLSKIIKHFGEVNILHNNAATKGKDINAFFAPFEEYSLDVWREVMSVNLDSFFLVAKIVGKQMIQQGKGGSIIQTSSVYGISAPDQRIYNGSLYFGTQINTPAVYSASKAGVLGLTQYLASYWAPYNIRVNALVLGGVASGQNELFQKNYADKVPLARMAESSEMSGALLFLASDLSSYITGQNIVIDGGMTCW